MRIGIDLDGVCYQWTKTARYMLREILPNSPYHKHGPLGQECSKWDYIKDHVSKEHNDWLWKEGVELGLFRHGHLFPGTIKALRALAKYGRLVAITQRPHRASEDTFAWINFHRLPFREVHILQGEPKTEVAQCDVYIDDRPKNCIELKTAFSDSTVCIPDRPWNQEFSACASGCVRTYSWDEFVQIAKRGKNDAAIRRERA